MNEHLHMTFCLAYYGKRRGQLKCLTSTDSIYLLHNNKRYDFDIQRMKTTNFITRILFFPLFFCGKDGEKFFSLPTCFSSVLFFSLFPPFHYLMNDTTFAGKNRKHDCSSMTAQQKHMGNISIKMKYTILFDEQLFVIIYFGIRQNKNTKTPD